jgi:hypothetical protein
VHIGLDLGAALTKLVRYPVDSGHPPDDEPGPGAASIEQTAVVYHQLESEIPSPQSTGGHPAHTVRCDGFPLMLDSQPHTFVDSWGGRTAAEVTQSYLRCLRIAEAPRDGNLVLAVAPLATPAQRTDPPGSGSSITTRAAPRVRAVVPDILTALGRPPSRVVAAPVAAVAYLRHTRAELAGIARFIVCDIGAGSLTIAFCTVGPHGTQLVDCVRLTGSAAWSEDTAGFTEAGQRPPALIELLVTDLAKRTGAPALASTVRRWRGLEWLLDGHGDWPSAVRDAQGPGQPRQRGRQQRVADLRVTTNQLLAACLPLAERAAAALRAMIRSQREADWRVSGSGARAKVVFLGGLAGLGPIRAALLSAAGADPAEPGEAVLELDPATRLRAVAHGAALVASGQVRPSQPYPHALRLPVYYVSREQLESTDLELAPAGTIEYDEPERLLVDAHGEPLTVEVRPGPAPFPVQIVPFGSGKPVPASFMPVTMPLAGQYRVAVGGGADGVTVALHAVSGTGTVRFVLDDPAVLPRRASGAWRMRKVLIPMAGLGRVPRCLAMLAVTTSALLGSVLPAAASVAPAPASAVAAALGADKIPAALVILVDTSESMAPPAGLYPRVYEQLPKFLAALARQDPQDEVAVVQFAGKEATRTISPMGPPTPNIPLLRNPAFTGGTDIGYAFQVALNDLAQDKNAQVGGIMLLSDGGISAPSDPVYDGGAGYKAPGWAKLRQQVQGLGIPVTGYGLPLTTSQSEVSALNGALSACFGSQQFMLTSNFDDLSSQFATAQQKILNSRVAVAAAPDSGHGVKVSWGGTGASDGTVQLNPSTGNAQLSVRFTATTRRVPLSVTGVSVTVTGFPEKISASIVPAAVSLRPGQSETVPLRLTWPPLAGGNFPSSGTISLRASVKSPDSNAIRNFYQDSSFTVGGLSGSVSSPYLASIPAPSHLFALILTGLVVLLAAAGATFYVGARLSGWLGLRAVGGSIPPVSLPGRPWHTFTVTGLGGMDGRVTVWRTPFTREMHIKHSKFQKKSFALRRDGRVMVAGIEISHHAGYSDDSRANV